LRATCLHGVWAAPVDENNYVNGKAFLAMIKDVTEDGIGLVTTTPSIADAIAIRLPGEFENVAFRVDVLWRTPLGAGFYLFGGKVTSLVAGESFETSDHIANEKDAQATACGAGGDDSIRGDEFIRQ
jgi:hypothetical protein